MNGIIHMDAQDIQDKIYYCLGGAINYRLPPTVTMSDIMTGMPCSLVGNRCDHKCVIDRRRQ